VKTRVEDVEDVEDKKTFFRKSEGCHLGEIEIIEKSKRSSTSSTSSTSSLSLFFD
jgi:hypothetical protein